MIRSFKNDAARAVFNSQCPKGFPAHAFKTARRKLKMIHAAASLDDLKCPPGNKLHLLTGDRRGQYAVWINSQYRVCFFWSEVGVHDVEIIDYH